jgi:hypothetical protein
LTADRERREDVRTRSKDNKRFLNSFSDHLKPASSISCKSRAREPRKRCFSCTDRPPGFDVGRNRHFTAASVKILSKNYASEKQLVPLAVAARPFAAKKMLILGFRGCILEAHATVFNL